MRDKPAFLEGLVQDLRFGTRQILRGPGFSLLVMVTLAVGIGGNVAIFSVLKGIVLRQLPYQEPERLVAVWESPPERRWYQPFSSPDYLDVREQAASLEEIGVLEGRWFNLAGEGEPERIVGASCTPSLLKLLGVAPAQGRLFTEDEQIEGNHRVLILSHALWQGGFAGAPDVVGRSITVDGEPYVVVGVMPEGFEFPTPWGGRDETRLWTPLLLSRKDEARGSHSYGAVARLADGVTPKQAEAEIRGIARRLAGAHPATNARVTMWVEPMMRRTLGGIRSALVFLFAVVGLVLLVSCANVASMLLARGAQRMPELAVRASIGASRGRLIRQLLTESSILSLLGGTAGVAVAYSGVRALKAVLPDTVPRVAGIQMDVPVLGFAASITMATGLLFGLAPALVASRADLVSSLSARPNRGGGRSRRRFLGTLVVAQLAIGFVLVNAAALLLVSYDNVVSQPMNFETHETLVAGVSSSGPAYEEPPARLAFWQELRERVRALPGVVAAGVTSKLPLRGGSNGGVLVKDQVFDPEVERELVEYSFVDDGYHRAMGISLISGRLLDQQDLDHASAAAGLDVSPVELPLVINRTMAKKLWPGEEPLGQLVRNNDERESYRARVVGVVEDVRQWGPENRALPEMYFPYTAEVWGPSWAVGSKLVVRARGNPRALVSGIRAALREIDPHIPLADVATMNEVVQLMTGRRRFSVLLVGLFALTALVLNVAGLYGVMSNTVTRRTHEIGVRIALGSNRARVFRLFLVAASQQLLAGLVVGLAGTLAAATTMRSMVYGVSVWNPAFMLAAAGVIVPTTFVAIVFPVRRACRVNPVQALHTE
jgi:putative ABC transport system permease protein